MLDAAPSPTKRWLNRREAVDHLCDIGCPISKRTLEKMASSTSKHKGPPFTRAGWRTVRYAQSDLDAWAKNNTTRVE